MVSFEEIQAAYYMVAATGVLVAAVYYIIVVRINQRNMRITLTNNLIQRLMTDEFMEKYTELVYMDWGDYDDFEKRYGSDTNPENFMKRVIVFSIYDSLGTLLKQGLADKDILYNSQMAYSCTYVWHKFRGVLEENRRLYSGADAWNGFEYLANEMVKMKRVRDPNYRVEMGNPRYDESKKKTP